MPTITSSSVSDGLIAHQQSVLDAIQKNTSGTITGAFANMIAAVMPSAARFRSAYATELQRVQDEAEDDSPTPHVSLYWLVSSGMLNELLRAINDNIEKANKAAQEAAIAGAIQARQQSQIITAAMTAQAAGVSVSQVQQPAPDEGTDETVDMPSNDTGSDVKKAIMAGLLAGLGGQALMQGVQTVLTGALQAALGVGDSTAASAMQQGMQLVISANSGLLDGWIWTAEGGACIACLEMDGSFHTWDEDMDSHPNCGCMQVPYSGPPSGLDDYAGQGEDYFNSLDDSEQAAILGPSKYLAWKNGDIQLMDLVSKEGGFIHERSLKDLGLDFRDYLQQLPTKRELLQLPDISLLGPHPMDAVLTDEERTLLEEAQLAYAAEVPKLPEINVPESEALDMTTNPDVKFISKDDVAAWTAGNAEDVPATGWHYGTPEHIDRLLQNGIDVSRNRIGVYGRGFYMWNGELPEAALEGDKGAEIAIHMENPFHVQWDDYSLMEKIAAEHPDWATTPEWEDVGGGVTAPKYERLFAEEIQRQGYDGVLVFRDGKVQEEVAIKAGTVRVINDERAAAEAAARVEEATATTVEVSPEVKALQDQRATLATQRDAVQSKLDTLSEKWRAAVLDQAKYDPEDDAEEWAAAEKKITAIEKQQATQMKNLDMLNGKMAKVDAKIQKAMPEVKAVESPFGTVEDIHASQEAIDRLYGDLPIGDPMTMQEAAFGNNPLARIGDTPLKGADPALVAGVERAAQIQQDAISNLASRLADNKTFLRFARYMGYDQDQIDAGMTLYENALRSEAAGRTLDEEAAKLAAMTRQEAQAWAKQSALESTVFDIFEAFHSIPAAGSELFVQTPLQIAMQEAVKSEFGLKTAIGYWSDEAIAATKEEWGTYQNGIRAFFRGMYDETQAYFQEKGITEVQLFRGLRWTEDEAPTGIAFDGQVIQSVVDSAPMTSWASNPEVALDYARDIGGTARPATEAADVGMLLATKVPVDQVLSTPFTGFGTSVLREMILLGKPEDALALPFSMDNAPSLEQFIEEIAAPQGTVAEAAANEGEGAAAALTYTLPEIDQEAEDKLVQQIQDALSGDGVASHADVMALGQPIQDYLDERMGPLADYAREAYQIIEPGAELTDAQKAWYLEGDTSQHGGLTVKQVVSQYQATMREETARLLGQVRDVGGEINLADGADETVAAALKEVQQYLPTDWIEASNEQSLLTLETQTGKVRGFYQPARDGSGTIALATEGKSAAEIETAMAHEIGHRMQDSTNGIWLLEKEFYNARTVGNDLVELDKAFEVVGKTRVDAWALEYIGKEPILVQRSAQMVDLAGQKLRTIYNYELLSTGLEWLYGKNFYGQYLLNKDPEFLQWLLGVLFGAKDHVV